MYIYKFDPAFRRPPDYHGNTLLRLVELFTQTKMAEEETRPLPSLRPSPHSLSSISSGVWKFFGTRLPRAEIEYIFAMTLIFIVVISSLVMLAFGIYPEVFVSLLGLCLGVILPAPSRDSLKRLPIPRSQL